MKIISNEDRQFFKENGYVKLNGLIPKSQCDAVIEAIWAFLERDRNNREDWYNLPEGVMAKTRTLELYHHQTMWDNRQYPPLYQAFSEILGEQKLWVSTDRVNMTPPHRADHPEMDNNFIHWDTDTSNLPSPIPHPYGVQGILYLADTVENQGGFQCVPTIYRELEAWIKSQPADRNPRIPDIGEHEVKAIPGKAGDFLIWDKLLPHGNGMNYTEQPRYAQYITMMPAKAELEARKYEIEGWKNNTRPQRPNDTYPYKDHRFWEQKNNGGPAKLTPLGRKLLGLDAW